MSNKISIAFADLKLRGTKVSRPKSTFLGYADATLVITAGDVEVLQFRLRNMQIKVVNGTFRVDFHAEKVGDKWIPTCFPKTAISRERLTAALKRAYAAHLNSVKVAA